MKDIKMRTLYKYPFLGSVIAGVPLVEDLSIKTAATDGKTIYVNTNFFNKLTKDEQVFLYAHEVLHIAFDHISRRVDKQPKLWNRAADAVINELLQEDGLPIIKGGVQIKGSSKKTAEMVYAELLKEQREQKQKNDKNQGQKNQGQGNEQGDQDEQESEDQDEQNQGQNQDKNKKLTKKENSEVGHDSHEMWEDAIKTEQDGIDAKALSIAVQRAAKTPGNITTSVKQAFAALDLVKPVVNWKYLLRQSLKENIDWSYQDAEFENNVLYPNLERKPHNETEIMVDTSGSVSNELLQFFLSEVCNILKSSKVKVGCFDTEFYGFKEVTRRNINSFEVIGRGGTDFNVAVNAFSRGAVNRIILTDGYASMPEKATKAIWLVVGEKKIEPKGGKVIHITEQELEKIISRQNNDRSL